MKALIKHMQEDIELIDRNLESINTPEVRTYFEGQRAAFIYAIRLVNIFSEKDDD